MYCNLLQFTAIYCNLLQFPAIYFRLLHFCTEHYWITHCTTLHYTRLHMISYPAAALHCPAMQCTDVYFTKPGSTKETRTSDRETRGSISRSAVYYWPGKRLLTGNFNLLLFYHPASGNTAGPIYLNRVDLKMDVWTIAFVQWSSQLYSLFSCVKQHTPLINIQLYYADVQL